MLLELFRRRGKIRPEELARLDLVGPVEPQALKVSWLAAMEDAEKFMARRDPQEMGCLYYCAKKKNFIQPGSGDKVVPHFGRPGGVFACTQIRYECLERYHPTNAVYRAELGLGGPGFQSHAFLHMMKSQIANFSRYAEPQLGNRPNGKQRMSDKDFLILTFSPRARSSLWRCILITAKKMDYT